MDAEEIGQQIADLRARGGTPEYWAERGYTRNWGDAAVMRYPDLEILRRDDAGKPFQSPICTEVEYIIVGRAIGSYIRIRAKVQADGTLLSWGEY